MASPNRLLFEVAFWNCENKFPPKHKQNNYCQALINQYLHVITYSPGFVIWGNIPHGIVAAFNHWRRKDWKSNDCKGYLKNLTFLKVQEQMNVTFKGLS